MTRCILPCRLEYPAAALSSGVCRTRWGAAAGWRCSLTLIPILTLLHCPLPPSAAEFAQIDKAYRILLDPAARGAFDDLIRWVPGTCMWAESQNEG